MGDWQVSERLTEWHLARLAEMQKAPPDPTSHGPGGNDTAREE